MLVFSSSLTLSLGKHLTLLLQLCVHSHVCVSHPCLSLKLRGRTYNHLYMNIPPASQRKTCPIQLIIVLCISPLYTEIEGHFLP